MSEPFELEQLLGHGGFADTYLARVRDADLQRRWDRDMVAIKIPKDKAYEKVLIQEIAVGTLLREALRELEAAANVVRYLDFELFRGDYVMVMEYCREGSLRELIGEPGRRRPLEVGKAVTLTQGILHGLEAIHDAGIFHRDIKPENILLDGDTPKVSDLGIATMLHRARERAYSTIGTFAYMAPEIIESAGGSFTSDIWSVGVTLYEMLTGSWPFGDESTPMRAWMTRTCAPEPPDPPSARRAGIPGHLDDVVLKALSREPAGRFQTPAEMRHALTPRDSLEESLARLRAPILSPERADETEAELRALVAEHPDSARAHQVFAGFLNRCQRPQEAMAALNTAIGLDPASAQLHWDYALACQRGGSPDEAFRGLERALALGLDAGLERHAKNLLHALRRGAA